MQSGSSRNSTEGVLWSASDDRVLVNARHATGTRPSSVERLMTTVAGLGVAVVVVLWAVTCVRVGVSRRSRGHPVTDVAGAAGVGS